MGWAHRVSGGSSSTSIDRLSGRRRRRGEIRGCERRQTRRQMASGDLARRPPGRARRSPPRRRNGLGLGARMPWRLTGQEHPAQDRAKRTNVDLGARADGDLACDDLAHLGGEPTLLDRHVGRVAGRVDVFEPVHAAVVVDRDEPVRPLGKPSIPGPSILGRVTTRSTTSRPAGERLRLASPIRGRKGSGKVAILFRQQLADRLARLRAEQLQWRRLGRHQHQLNPSTLGRKARRGQQGELVERQRPSGLARQSERDAPDPAALEVLEQIGEPLAGAGSAEGERFGKRSPAASTAGDHQAVVAESPYRWWCSPCARPRPPTRLRPR